MLVKIKPHSAFKSFFSQKEYVADLKTYSDIFYYLNGMHKRFIHYLRKQKQQGIEESFVLLDKNLRVISPEEVQLKHAKDGDVIHIVPAIVGGGGKRGSILAVLAVAAFVFVALPAIGVGSAIMSAGGSFGSAVAGGLGSIGAGGFGAGAAAGLAALKASPFLMAVVVNVGIALLTSLFATKPSEGETRQNNDMFGSLTNSTDSGTPVALHYGLMRVAGQMINGYILSLRHAKSSSMNVYGEIVPFTTTPVGRQETTRREFLSGFNSFT